MRVALLYNPTIPEARHWADRARSVFPDAELCTQPPDVDRVVVFGGDGTVHALLNSGSTAEVAIVPCGSGNDFVKTLGIPRDPAEALKLAGGPARPMDVVAYEVGNRRGKYLNIAEVGFGGRVVAHATKLRSVTGRKMSYSLGILTALAGHRLRPIALEIDGRVVGEFLATNLIVANGQYFGSGMRPMPDARPDDGLLDIALLNEFGRWKILTQAKVLRTGLPKNHQKIHHFRGREVRATSRETVAVEADGEVLGNLPACFRVLHHGLRVVCP